MKKSRQRRKMYGYGGGSKRQMYNQGSIAAHKSIGDLDISLRGYGSSGGSEFNHNTGETDYFKKQNAGSNFSVTARKGPFTVSHMSGVEKLNTGKVNYSNSSLGVDTKAGRFGTDKQGNVSYSTTTKRGTTISARANNKGGSLSIFKEL